MIVMVGGEKGGVGKTTLATHLAVARKAQGSSVVLVDADSQGTSSTWSDARKEHPEVPQVPCVSLRGGKVHVELKELARHYDDVIVDTGGADSQEFRSAMLGADILLMPLRPGSFDFWTLLKMQEVVSLAEGFNDSLRALVVLSQVPPSATDRARKEATEILADMPRFQLLKQMTVFRAAFNHSAGEGLTVDEMPRRDPKACSEIAFLHDELFGEA
ncbi:CobQ/CobB/MinD/ParA nucleotide binding domain protein [Acetobacteraceae bacterium AT-5844]|nr:CobQ/CobB/MinD/ParA nucleotide binding domain protein [Acetobacteraceae bacterium AT-5844]